MKKYYTFICIVCVLTLFIGSCKVKSTGDAVTLGDDAPLASIVPVAALPLPSEVKKIPASAYAYDDLSIRTKIEFLGGFYGIPNSIPDPVAQYLGNKYNADITWTAANYMDHESIISTRFAAGDEPDVLILGVHLRNVAELLYDQGLVADAEIAMRYMPNFAQYFSKEYADFITYKGVYSAAPRYPINLQSDIFLRKDWLEKFGMDMPETLEELLVYARRVTFEDPDGNGRNDSWFAGGAGSGQSFGMLSSLLYYFGNPDFNVKNGKINHPYLDGTYKNYLAFLKQLNDEGLLSPDWYTVSWEAFKSYSLNNRIGFIHYPTPNLLSEMILAGGLEGNPGNTSWDVWAPLPPLGTGKTAPNSGPSVMFVFPVKTLRDPVKFKRICHILDQSLFGGEDYLETIQAGGNTVYGREVFITRMNPDGSLSFCVNKNTHPTWTGELDTTGLANAGWQEIGLAGPPFHLEYRPDNPHYNDTLNRLIMEQSGYNRWPNSFNLKFDPDLAPFLGQFTLVEEPKFVLGGRTLERWDDYINEWLNRGGRKVLAEAARQLNVANFE